MSYISGGTTKGVLRLSAPTPAPAVSLAGEGRIYFDGTQFLASQNGAAYTAVVGGGGGGGWTDDGTVVRLTTVGDGVGIGTAAPAASSKLEVLGDATRVNVFVTGGNPGGAGTGGSLVYTAGAGGVTGAGGVVGITGGAGGTTSGAAGGVSLLGGTPSDGNGGAISLTGSAGLGTNRAGGGVTVTCGNATGTGAGGVLQLTSGTSPTGTAGSIRFATGTTGATTERVSVSGVGTTFFGDGTLTTALGGSGATGTSISAYRNENNAIRFSAFTAASAAASPGITYLRGRGTAAVPAIVASGDTIGALSFQGVESVGGSQECARISVEIDGAPGVGDMPGRIAFFTTPDGSGSAGILERMRIKSNGHVVVGTGDDTATTTVGVIRSPQSTGAGAAGDLNISAGGGFGTGTGGNLFLSSGGSNGSTAGAISVTGGVSSSGTGGGITVTGGLASNTDTCGAVTILGGGGTGGQEVGGAVTLGGGNAGSTGNGAGGATTIVGGSGRGTGAGGNVTIAAGATFASGVGGTLAMSSGGSTSSTGGPVTLTAGLGTTGGSITITGGIGSLAAGAVSLTGGAGSASGSSPAGGAASLVGGAGGTPNGNGGNVLITAGAATGAGTSGSVTITAPTAGTDGDISFVARGQTATYNDATNTAFAGAASGATSLVGAINQIGSGTGTGAVVGIGSARGTGASRTLATLPSNLITAAGDRIECEARGDLDAAGTFLFAMGGTTLFTSTAVLPGGAPYVARFTLVRVTDTTADWWATLLVEGSVVYSDGATAATVPSLTNVNATPNCSVTGATSTVLNLVGTAIKA